MKIMLLKVPSLVSALLCTPEALHEHAQRIFCVCWPFVPSDIFRVFSHSLARSPSSPITISYIDLILIQRDCQNVRKHLLVKTLGGTKSILVLTHFHKKYTLSVCAHIGSCGAGTSTPRMAAVKVPMVQARDLVL